MSEAESITDPGAPERISRLRLLVSVLFTFFLVGMATGAIEEELHRRSVSPGGGPDPFFTTLPILLLLFCAGCVLTAATQPHDFGCITSILGLVAFLIGTSVFHGNARYDGFARAGRNLEPVIQAISSYHDRHGTYPDSLENLVPEFLPKLPSTDMANYPGYNYTKQAIQGNPWMLVIPAGYGMGFDEFIYLPLQNYPNPGPYRRVGKWAYCLE